MEEDGIINKNTTSQQDWCLCIFASRNRFISAAELKDTFRGIMEIRLYKSVIHNRLHGMGLKARSPFKGM